MAVKMNPQDLDLPSLVQDEREALVRFLGRMVGEANAEDVAQLVLLKAANHLAGYRGEASPRAWLFGIATNAARDWLRGHSLVSESLDAASEADELLELSEDSSQERRLVREQMSQCVGEFLARLPESY